VQLAQIAQTAAPAGGLALLGTALTLGVRHGIDWDHLAAITDITGTATNVGASPEGTVAGGAPLAARLEGAAPAFGLGRTGSWALLLASSYALGHALVVALLGLAALFFAAILPEWVDPIMERVVGVTLLVLGAWVAYSLVRSWRGEAEFRLQSRWMLVFAGVRRGWHALQARRPGHRHDGTYHLRRVEQYGPRSAFGVGVLHGIGAETGSQVLIIAAVGGASSQGLGTAMLFAFVVGLLLSNTLLALLTSSGFATSSRGRALYVAAGCLAAVFSLVVGAFFVLGAAGRLPDLQDLTAFLGGPPGPAPAGLPPG
jgi:high-affinity nickel-transport protein